MNNHSELFINMDLHMWGFLKAVILILLFLNNSVIHPRS